jgi:methylated-DNA-[protein]-cysteine S-methyltransferase
MSMMMISALPSSPLGMILIESDASQIHRISLVPPGSAEISDPGTMSMPAAEAVAQLEAYFDGRSDRFDLPLAPASTARGEALRRAIVDIPPGETRSYGEVARLAASSPRAVGQACARNPFPIVVPCHRVLGTGGAIGHYSAGDGVATKRWLLEHERRGGLL